MIIDFWNTNLNPVTMFSKQIEKQTDSYKGRINLGKSEFNPDTHILSTDAMKLTGLRAKILKKKIENNGCKVFVYYSKTVYLKESLEQIKL